ncbi:MAG: dehydrogenase, partial [Spirochaetaceae bacterium]|nr:dehydrogenase [Spirochaetaceae bacterium]
RNELEASLVLYYTGVSRESANIIKEQITHTQKGDKENLESMHQMKKQAEAMKEALLRGEFENFSQCLLQGWEAKKRAARSITNTFLDALYRYALEHGGKSAKISGAGGGGFMMIYCDPCGKTALVRALQAKAEPGGAVLTPSFTEIGTQAWTIYKN